MKISTKIKIISGVSLAAVLAIAPFVLFPGVDTAQGSAQEKDGVVASAEPFDAPYATPAGITLQPLGKAQGYSLDKQSAAALPRDEIVFADTRGLTLYTAAADPEGESTCYDACAEEFSPMLAADAAEPFGGWSLVSRKGGAKQWALNGKPLYTYFKDVDPGSLAGNSPAMTGAPRLDGAGKPVGGGFRGSYSGERPEPNVLPEGWSAAHLYPMPQLATPPGITVKETPDASAFALIDVDKHTLYVFDGEIGKETALCDTGFCVKKWEPLSAPLIARPKGEFGIVDRDDGIRQWTYKGKGLYTFSGDLAPGYANGARLRDDWKVAAVSKLYNPPGVTIQNTLSQGAVLANAEGMTLYRRDGHILQSGGGHNLRRGQPARPAVGRDIGTNARCGEACLETWSPFIAGADAEPRGFWNVAMRDDGRKQWTYKGYAIWSYAGDSKPGDMTGHDVYDIALNHDPKKVVDLGTPMDGGAALWWSIAVP